MLDISKVPHKRKNILTGEWVLVSPHRTKRPWQGKVESVLVQNKEIYDSNCYLCPGNKRANNQINPKYQSTFVFDNDYSALLSNVDYEEHNEFDLLISETEPGICRVVCYSPYHNLTMAQFDKKTIINVIDVWINQFNELSSYDNIKCITIFENKGELMGCSNSHPHGQIWAQYSIPNEVKKETEQQQIYFRKKRYCLLCDYLLLEKKKNERIVFENNLFIVLVPYWAVWPFETIIIPKNHNQNILKLDDEEKRSLADVLKIITLKYDKVFNTSFPYSMGIHQAPTDGQDYKEWHWHIHFYPPLLRSASVKKFMVGFEMLAMPQRDLTPEEAAEILKNL